MPFHRITFQASKKLEIKKKIESSRLPIKKRSSLNHKTFLLKFVFQLAFRQCRVLRDQKLYQTCRHLHLDPRSSSTLSLRQEATRCMGAAAGSFPLHDAEEQVLRLVCDTLKEYECLEHCAALKKYVEETVKVVWRLVCHVPEYELDTGKLSEINFDGDYST